MTVSTTYRLWTHIRDELEVRRALAVVDELPTSDAREANFDWWMGRPAMFDGRTSFSDCIPKTQPDRPRWVIEGDIVVLCLDLVNPYARHDDGPWSVQGEPSRNTVLMKALSAISSDPDGTIVGARQGEYEDDWSPLVVWKGAILPMSVPGADNLDKQPAEIGQHPGTIDPDRIGLTEDGEALFLFAE